MNPTPSSKRLNFSIREIELHRIDRDPEQPREKFDEGKMRELAESIKETGGLIQLPVVKPHPLDTDRYLVVAGERRIRAMRIAGIDVYMFVVVSGATNTFKLSFVENLQREDLNVIEEARSMKKFYEQGATWDQVAAIAGKSLKTVHNRQKLLELPDEIQHMIIDGKLPSLESALNLAQYKSEKGELIRQAHRLIAGEEVLALAEGKVQRRDKAVLRKNPTSPEGLVRRVLDFGWRSKASVTAMDTFCGLTPDEQRNTWKQLQVSTRAALRERITDMQRALVSFISALDQIYPPLSANATDQGGIAEAAVAVVSTQATPHANGFGSNGSVPASPLPAQASAAVSTQAIRPQPAQPAQDGRSYARPTQPQAQATIRSAAPQTRQATPTSHKPHIVLKRPDVTMAKPATSLIPPELKSKPFAAPVYSAGAKTLAFLTNCLCARKEVLLSKTVLSRVLNVTEGPTRTEELVRSGLKAVREHWRSAPAVAEGDKEMEQFIIQISRCRYDLGSPEFANVIKTIQARDKSKDPVSLKEL